MRHATANLTHRPKDLATIEQSAAIAKQIIEAWGERHLPRIIAEAIAQHEAQRWYRRLWRSVRR